MKRDPSKECLTGRRRIVGVAVGNVRVDRDLERIAVILHIRRERRNAVNSYCGLWSKSAAGHTCLSARDGLKGVLGYQLVCEKT
jgi:hypothetical protein